LSSNAFTAEAGRESFDQYNLGMLANGTYTLEMFQWSIYNRAKTCYEIDHSMPSINTIGWAGVFVTPYANFTYVAGLPH
jgi:hypothetical protein